MKHDSIEAPSTVAQFLSALTELSHQTGIAVQDVQLYVMERDDSQREYRLSADSEMSFA